MSRESRLFFFIAILSICYSSGCISNGNSAPDEPLLVDEPRQMDGYVAQGIKGLLQYSNQHKGVIDSFFILNNDSLVCAYYKGRSDRPFWSYEGQSHPSADSLYNVLTHCLEWGLFPSDYNTRELLSVQAQIIADSTNKKDAMLWAKRDLLLTNGFFQLAHDLKIGRLERDSITLSKDSIIDLAYLEGLMKTIKDSLKVSSVLRQLEPSHKGYDSLKHALHDFLDTTVFSERPPTFVMYRATDSLIWVSQAVNRLREINWVDSSFDSKDTGDFKKTLRSYQKTHGLKVTGRLDSRTADKLNWTPEQQFRLIALNLDRYKHLPDTMPVNFLWVNIPAFYLQVWENDSIAFISRIVVGKPDTRTPQLSSRLTEIITYPQWNIPNSIVLKEVIPGIRKRADYLKKHNYMVVDGKGHEIDPSTLPWTKYKKSFPYKIIQGSGDDNALGILKFNFTNRYSVYMHDTNQRYLFGNVNRSMSHGCVRVQEWEKLAHYLLRGDTLKTRRKMDSLEAANPSIDSLKAWLKRKEKHYLPVRKRTPVFIRYFTCDQRNGKLRFFDDIYEEDRKLIVKHYRKSLQY